MKTNGKNTYLKLNEEGSKAIDDNRSYLEERITNCFRKCIKSIEAIMDSFDDWVLLMDSFDDWVLLYDVSVNLKHAGNKNDEYKTMVENQSYLEECITNCFRRHTEIITSIMNSFYDWVLYDSPIRHDYRSTSELIRRVDRFVYNDILLGVIVESMNAICNKYDGYSEYDRDEFQIFVRNRIMKDKEIVCDKFRKLFDYIIEDSPMSRSVNTRTGKYIILCLSQSCTDLEDLIVRELKHLLLDILSNTDLDCSNIVQDRGYDVTQIDTDFGKWSTFGGRPVK